MATNGRPSFNKRQKEQARRERQLDKAAKRQQRKLDKINGVTSGADDASGEPHAGASASPDGASPANDAPAASAPSPAAGRA